jgi:hypothetical protein
MVERHQEHNHPRNKSMESTRGRTAAGERTASALPPLAIADPSGVLNQMLMGIVFKEPLDRHCAQRRWRGKVSQTTYGSPLL